MRGFHHAVRRSRTTFLFRLAFGWWPCLRAPFVQLSIGHMMWDVWYGDPSYKDQRKGTAQHRQL